MFHLIPGLLSLYVIIKINVLVVSNGKYLEAALCTTGLLIFMIYLAIDYAQEQVKKAIEQSQNQANESQAQPANTPRNTPKMI